MVEPDEALLARSAQGDRQAYGRLMERYHAAVYAYAAARLTDRSLAEDVAQETFLRVWRSLAQVPQDGRFPAWLFGTARRVGLELSRRERRRRVEGRKDEPEDRFEEKNRMDVERLLAAVAQLPEDMQMILTLKYTEGISCGEISRRLGRPLGTVTSLLARAYHELRRQMEEEPA